MRGGNFEIAVSGSCRFDIFDTTLSCEDCIRRQKSSHGGNYRLALASFRDLQTGGPGSSPVSACQKIWLLIFQWIHQHVSIQDWGTTIRALFRGALAKGNDVRPKVRLFNPNFPL
jgi:hypothetical protein